MNPNLFCCVQNWYEHGCQGSCAQEAHPQTRAVRHHQGHSVSESDECSVLWPDDFVMHVHCMYTVSAAALCTLTLSTRLGCCSVDAINGTASVKIVDSDVVSADVTDAASQRPCDDVVQRFRQRLVNGAVCLLAFRLFFCVNVRVLFSPN